MEKDPIVADPIPNIFPTNHRLFLMVLFLSLFTFSIMAISVYAVEQQKEVRERAVQVSNQVLINDGALTTVNANVYLSFYAQPAASKVRIANTLGGLYKAQDRPFPSKPIEWVLQPGLGEKRVYAQFNNRDSGVWSEVVFDEIEVVQEVAAPFTGI